MLLWLGHWLAEDVKDLKSCTIDVYKTTEGFLVGSTLRQEKKKSEYIWSTV